MEASIKPGVVLISPGIRFAFSVSLPPLPALSGHRDPTERAGLGRGTLFCPALLDETQGCLRSFAPQQPVCLPLQVVVIDEESFELFDPAFRQIRNIFQVFVLMGGFCNGNDGNDSVVTDLLFIPPRIAWLDAAGTSGQPLLRGGPLKSGPCCARFGHRIQ
jgi:hypothetical protein